MTNKEWTERLRAFDRCREAHARELDSFRAQIEAARRTLGRLALQLEAECSAPGRPGGRKLRLKRSWRARAPRPTFRRRARAGRPRLREFAADGERWSVWETIPANSALFVVGRSTGEVDRGGRQGRSTGEVDRGGRQGRSTGEVDRGGRRGAAGWLTFMAGSEKRRYSPVPAGWQSWSEDRLRDLLRQAEVPAYGSRGRRWRAQG